MVATHLSLLPIQKQNPTIPQLAWYTSVMNTKKIKEAFDLMNAAFKDDDDEPVTLNVQMSKQDLDVLHDVCKMNISIPDAVVEYYPRIDRLAVKRVLNTIRARIDHIRS